MAPKSQKIKKDKLAKILALRADPTRGMQMISRISDITDKARKGRITSTGL